MATRRSSFLSRGIATNVVPPSSTWHWATGARRACADFWRSWGSTAGGSTRLVLGRHGLNVAMPPRIAGRRIGALTYGTSDRPAESRLQPGLAAPLLVFCFGAVGLGVVAKIVIAMPAPHVPTPDRQV